MSKNPNVKKIIITGSGGYIGSNLVKYFSKFKNYEILCIYRNKINLKVKKKNIKYLKHNLINKIPKNKIENNYDALLHFAGSKNDRLFVNTNKKKVFEGIKIDKNVIDFAVTKKIKLFIYASSAAVYDLKEGESNYKKSFKEKNVTTKTSYDGIYGYTKKYTENYLQKISRKKIKFVICRIFSIYGKNTKTIINIWKNKIKKNQTISIWSNKKIIRSWMHIDDFLSAISFILRKKKNFKIINIGSDEMTSLEDIIKIMQKKYKKKVKIKYNNDKYPGPSVRFANQKKLKKLGWKQKIYLSKGLDLI
tara:strand:- start:4256 stop:5173 length:918 start_codon:yes stop_codon:yes gene_type:complete